MSYDPDDIGRSMSENFGRESMREIARHVNDAYLLLTLNGIPSDTATSPYAANHVLGMLKEASVLGRPDLAKYISEQTGIELPREEAVKAVAQPAEPVADSRSYKFRDMLRNVLHTFRVSHSYASFL